MSAKNKTDKNLSEQEIDQIVISEADDDSAWESPIRVHRAESALVSIPADLAARAAFLAQLHRQTSVEEWLTRIIQERVELEEAAFVGVKRDLAKPG
jgi:hypothetical protein